MHIIATAALVKFWTKHPDSKSSLLTWHKLLADNNFESFHDLKRVFASVDHVNGLTVFNIASNKYRLIAALHYNRHKIYIRAILTHAEYDLNKWKRQ
jgi:mRNA interferase HigB